MASFGLRISPERPGCGRYLVTVVVSGGKGEFGYAWVVVTVSFGTPFTTVVVLRVVVIRVDSG